MIELGIVNLIRASVPGNGGYLAELPEGTALPAWSYLCVDDVAEYTFDGQDRLTMRRFQFDCYGDTAAQAMTLAKALNNVLTGYSGTLTDGDSTRVLGCFRANLIDFFDSESHTFRRMLEYEIHFYE